MVKKYEIQTLKSIDKKGVTRGETIRFDTLPNKFLSFHDVNVLYKEFAKRYDTSNVSVIIRNGLGREIKTTEPKAKKDMEYTTLKINDKHRPELQMDDDQYYSKYEKERDKGKFQLITRVEFRIKK